METDRASKKSADRREEIKRELKKNILIRKQEKLLQEKDVEFEKLVKLKKAQERLLQAKDEKLEELKKAIESIYQYRIRRNPLKKIKAIKRLIKLYPHIFH